MKKQVILITGASSGIGKNAALELLEKGHTVYGAARRVEQMQELEKAGGKALKMDITREDDVKTAVNKVIEEEGKIDVLVNNAGYGVYGAVEDTSIDDARHQFEVNMFGLARVTKLVLPHMRRQNSGKIINMSSMGGKVYMPLGAWYHATKHALEGWSDCLRLEVAPHGIDVVIIEPGVIKTEFGAIMADPILERSGNGAYAEMAQLFASVTKRTYNSDKETSPPSVITNLISKAVHADNPKTRYAAGKWAKPMIFLRKLVSDKLFDKIVMSQIK